MSGKSPNEFEPLSSAARKLNPSVTGKSNLSSRKLAERFLAALVESADDAIISKDLDGRITSWNQAAEKLFGYSAEEMIGETMLPLFPEDQVHEEHQILEKMRQGQHIRNYETRSRRKDGQIIDISITVSPILNEKGRVIGASKIARDITGRIAAETRERVALQRALEAQRNAEIANRTKDEFIATVSHELRTPLTAVLGWVRMLVSGTMDGPARERALGVIERNVKAQAQLIEDLLDMSRITTGKIRLDIRSVDPSAIIASAVEALRPAAEAKMIGIRTIIDSAANPIPGDAQRLQQVVWNLLSNAVKFTPNGGRIEMTVRKIDSRIELSVADSGIGIAPDFLPFVFNRFTQADGSITRVHGGLGLGLAIVKSIVELHGGVAEVFSEGPGKGTKFVLTFPAAARTRPPAPDETSPTSNVESLDAARRLAGRRILVIDDERDTCDMLRFVFQDCGAIVETCRGALEGLQLLDDWNPDVLVCDIGMPGMDGYEFIRRVRAGEKAGIPAVALTALARIEDRMKALSAGYHMHVAKPVEPSELITIVANIAA